MAVHSVTVKLPPIDLSNSDLVVEVAGQGGKLGELHLSRGDIRWFARSKKTSTRYTWEQFAKLMSGE